MELAPHGPDTYVGTGPGYPWEGLYGGQIVAQALKAAELTVDPGFVPTITNWVPSLVVVTVTMPGVPSAKFTTFSAEIVFDSPTARTISWASCWRGSGGSGGDAAGRCLVVCAWTEGAISSTMSEAAIATLFIDEPLGAGGRLGDRADGKEDT